MIRAERKANPEPIQNGPEVCLGPSGKRSMIAGKAQVPLQHESTFSSQCTFSISLSFFDSSLAETMNLRERTDLSKRCCEPI